jgi:predicted XRE-type DNA-binding protein
MMKKGRHVVGRRDRGVEHHNHKLTPELVDHIRKTYSLGGVSQQSIADSIGVSQTEISAVVRRIIWA